ncbi:YegP family protein [Paraflavitalea sp. CAU 1676]|uniref:YegP family protein n=1 Tax=Paraflavitalea sp. CAU 1676 TaxID=3032598 RepID=UPI0023DC5116|nr:YegP family protein [Paraflavitalea sp. CAU 1676]MDF2186817.1 YegP family protein [Paraflavitalea sp. CAU 1676]
MGKFIVSKRSNGEYQFKLIATNGQIILSSEGYATKSSCENGIASVKTNSQDDSKFIRKTASNGLFYFNLKANNGEVIGTSEMYASESGRESGIYSVKVNAGVGKVEYS